MPELPEVENMKIGLQPCVELTISTVYSSGKKLRKIASNVNELPLESIENSKIISIERLAKYLLIKTNNDYCCVCHAGMSGKFLLENPNMQNHLQNLEKNRLIQHDHVKLQFTCGTVLIYNDTRRFGMFAVYHNSDIAKISWLNKIAIDALHNNFNVNYFQEHSKHRNGAIKQVLLDQSFVAGLGNIYVCEALFLSNISPLKPTNTLTVDEITRLISNIKDILHLAIMKGGSTLKDYSKSDGSAGGFQDYFKVYGQENKPCCVCSAKILRIVQNGRSTFYCKECQKA